ncbi:hypothetical protein BOW53_15970 [Solemya pervernicosa gill symbiont]|uniref:Conjugal transfer protein TrbH n=1 Tax=Solemya pervernicosa gill symbiont TaxID=642797 RepID=A0A1T2L014_9GAMM|nr:hypothetical protein [Solemya pervernicosa gill symbiont]OOZ38316.1 hypothetical protein BOW53_15970 [Solemya pervernicosa gill symbiont]
MKQSAIVYLFALLTGCASTTGFNSYQDQDLTLSEAQIHKLTHDAVGRIEANYPPAKTLISLEQDKGTFGAELEHQLRAKGYGVKTPLEKKGKESMEIEGEVVPDFTTFRYEVKHYAADHVLLVVQASDGFQANRVYKKGVLDLQAKTPFTEMNAGRNE